MLESNIVAELKELLENSKEKDSVGGIMDWFTKRFGSEKSQENLGEEKPKKKWGPDLGAGSSQRRVIQK